MTSSGKVRIYELSRDLGLDNKDVLDAAEKLGVAAKSHSSSISDDEALRIRNLITGSAGNGGSKPSTPPAAAPAKAILSVKKAAPTTAAAPTAPPAAPAAPARPVVAATPVAKPAAAPARN